MSKYVTKSDLADILEQLELTKELHFFSHVSPLAFKPDVKSENELIPRKELNREVDRLDDNDREIADSVDEIEENLDLLLDYLGLEIQDHKRIVKKKGKK